MVPLVFHPEVMLDFVVVRHVHGDGRKSSVIIYYCPSSFCFNDNETEQHLIFKMGVTLDAVLVEFLRLTMRNL